MKIILLIALVGLCLTVFVVNCRWLVNYKRKMTKDEEAKKVTEFEDKLRSMSDLDLKLWLADLRKNLYLEEYDAPEMRQVIKDEVRRRGFTLQSLSNFKI